MALVNRVWQFALGFFAYELRQDDERNKCVRSSCYPRLSGVDPFLLTATAKLSPSIAVAQPSPHSKTGENRRLAYAVEQLAYYALPALIAAGVCIPLYSASLGTLLGRQIQLDRLFLLALVVVLLARRGPHAALSSSAACFLGDASYSIYLVHWPIFVWARYAIFDDQFGVLGAVSRPGRGCKRNLQP